MVKILRQKPKGNIALTSVLILSNILIFSSLTLLMTTVNFSFVANNSNNNELLKIISHSCMEESMNKLKNDNSYTGTINLTVGTGSCSSVIQNNISIANMKTLSITSISGKYNFSETYNVSTAGTILSIVK